MKKLFIILSLIVGFLGSGCLYNDTFCHCQTNKTLSQIRELKLLPLPPLTPSDLTYWIIKSDSVVLRWIDNSDNENGFIVERSMNNEDNYRQIIVTQPNATSLADYGLQPNTLYYYRIKAYNSGGESVDTKIKLSIPAGKNLF